MKITTDILDNNMHITHAAYTKEEALAAANKAKQHIRAKVDKTESCKSALAVSCFGTSKLQKP